DHVQQIRQQQGALEAEDASLPGVFFEWFSCQKIFYTPDQSGNGLPLDQDRGLDDEVEPVPGGNAGKLAALPVENRPGALRGNFDIPGRKIAVLNGGVYQVPAEGAYAE